MNLRLGLIVIVLTIGLPCVWAHEGEHDRLRRLDESIATSPKEGELYLRRAILLVQLGHAEEAVKTLRDAKTYASPLPNYPLVLGQSLLAAGKVDDAVTVLAGFCEENPTSTYGRLAYARALRDAQRFGESADAFSALIDMSSRIAPDLYLECASAYGAADRESDALAVLERGLQASGPLVVLQSALVARYIALERYDDAVGVLDKMIAAHSRHETFMLRKAQVLVQAGRRDEARVTCERALSDIDAQEPRLRDSDHARSIRAALLAIQGEAP